MKTVYIYALVDPRTGEARYVGKANNVKQRVQNHLCPCNLKRTRHVCRWLAGLLMQGLTPEVVILETLTDDWQKAEREWISMFRAKGVNLTNILDGGEGGATYGRIGKPWTEEQRVKYRASRVGVSTIASPEAVLARSRANKAAWEKRHAAGIFKTTNHSAETRAKMSAIAKGRDMTLQIEASAMMRRGKPMPESQRIAIGTGNRGKKRTEKQKANYRTAWKRRKENAV